MLGSSCVPGKLASIIEPSGSGLGPNLGDSDRFPDLLVDNGMRRLGAEGNLFTLS